MRSEADIKKLLIIRMSSMGDILLTSPMIELLRERFPHAQIDFLVRQEYGDLVKYNPFLNHVILFNVRDGIKGLFQLRRKIQKTGYDVILDVHRNFRSIFLRNRFWFLSRKRPMVLKIRKNVWIRFLLVKFKKNLYRSLYGRVIPVWEKYVRTAQPLGIQNRNPGIRLYLPDKIKKEIGDYCKDLMQQNGEVVVAPGARHFTKRWPPDYYAELIKLIYEKYGQKCILVGGREDIPIAKQIISLTADVPVHSVVGEFSILQTAALIERAHLVICNDSGLMHIAAAYQKPTIAFFGSTVQEFGFFPANSKAIVLENQNLSCRPCSHIGRSRCPKKHFRCLIEITPQQVLVEIEKNRFLS